MNACAAEIQQAPPLEVLNECGNCQYLRKLHQCIGANVARGIGSNVARGIGAK
jgi:hypothetical protein